MSEPSFVPPSRKTWFTDLLLLVVVFAALLGPSIGRRALWEPDEGRYAEIPREMVETGDYLTPRINGIKYFEKPPLVYWATAAAIRIAGTSEAAVRSPIALFAFFGAAAVYLAGRRLFSRAAGLWSALVLATSPLYLGLGQVLSLDMPVSALLTASLLAFLLAVREPPGWNRRFLLWAFYAAAALAVLSKGLIGVLIPALVIGAWILLTRQWRLIPMALAPTGIFVFLAIAAPWHLLAAQAHPEFAWFYFVHEHFQRYLTKVHNRYEPPWYFVPVLLGGLLPWTLFLPQALKDAWRTTRPADTERRETLFLALWAALVFGFFSLSDSKLMPYVLPAVPPLALLVGRWIASIAEEGRQEAEKRSSLRPALWVLLLLGLLLAAAVTFWPTPPDGTKDRAFIDLLGGFRPALAVCFAFIGLAPFVMDRLCKRRASLVAVVLGNALLFTTLGVLAPRFDAYRSAKPLAKDLRPQLQPGDEVASYHFYPHTLAYYLERRITIVGYTGELEFGTRHDDTRAWVIDDLEFWRRWSGPGRVYAMVDTRHKKPLPVELLEARVVGEGGGGGG
ncbi:MAG TPA: phospholipid carrier-dependent glycosyltransferase, partial [Thermoanaerobaculia bacterium]|nr:phospholipid carrier-dependent glycosyltransferase [Thermoanaerobaculia bacterium]